MKTAKLQRWNDLTEEVKAPQTVMLAMMTGRSELLKLAPKAAATEEETAALYNTIRVLMDTNLELQNHSQKVADEMKNLKLTLQGMKRKFDELFALASFAEADDESEEE
jgi:ABC-type siderophore export system fused ATPase/permease subunit